MRDETTFCTFFRESNMNDSLKKSISPHLFNVFSCSGRPFTTDDIFFTAMRTDRSEESSSYLGCFHLAYTVIIPAGTVHYRHVLVISLVIKRKPTLCNNSFGGEKLI